MIFQKRLPLYDPTCQTARSTFTHDEVHNNLTAQGVPKLYFEQFYRIRDHLDDIRSPKAHKLTRRALTADWPEWEASNYKQLSQFAQQRMFADPIPFPLMPPSSTGCGDSVKTNDAQTKRPVASATVSLVVMRTLDHSSASARNKLVCTFSSLFASRNKLHLRCRRQLVRPRKGAPPEQAFYMRVDGFEAWTEQLGACLIYRPLGVVHIETEQRLNI
jgi:hypothetical protein